MSIQRKFEDFRGKIELSNSDSEKIITTHTHLRQTILQKLDYVKNTILTGSYKRKTMIRPLNDIDVFVILNLPINGNGNPTPQSILNKLKRDLNSSYPNTKIRQDKPCVVIDFNHCKFELTPVIEGVNYYEIPNINNLNRWKREDSPEIIQNKLTGANRKNQMLIPLIKMMKRCKQQNKFKNPKSYEMELIAINQLTHFRDYKEGVIKLLELYGWLNWAELNRVKIMDEYQFSEYCRNTLFGNDFPRN